MSGSCTNRTTSREPMPQFARGAFAICAGFLAVPGVAAPVSSGGQHSAQQVPSLAAALPLRPGISKLGNGATLYVPQTLAASRAPPPLLLLFPGTGGGGRAMISALSGHADRGRFLLLAFTPRGENFDAVDYFFDDYEMHRARAMRRWPEPRFGADRANIEAVLGRLLARTRIDCGRIGLLGFSHGASYALSLGTAKPRLFASIQALSPGILVMDGATKGGQSIFLAHGRRDQAQPFGRTANAMVPRLRSLGFKVRFIPFDGGHTMTREMLAAAVSHFLAAPPPPACGTTCACQVR